MRIPALALLLICVTSCATREPYRDVTDRKRAVTDMQVDGAICQTVLPPLPPPQPPTLCPVCAAVDATVAKAKRQKLFDNCMKTHGWEATR